MSTDPVALPLGSPGSKGAPVLTRFTRPDAPTVLAFAGMGMGLQMPVAEFAGVLAPFDVNAVFVRDPHRAWFQNGVPGLGATPEQVAGGLRELVPPESAIAGTVGTSSGATGAVLLGSYLQVPTILAFSPRTRITPDAIAYWRQEFPDMPDLDIQAPTADLRAFLLGHPHGRVEVHVGRRHHRDVDEAEHLAGVPGVSITRHPTDWHASAAWLRQEGLLPRVLQDAFGLQLRPGEVLDTSRHDPAEPTRDWRPGPLSRAVRERVANWRSR